jgi:hypothetical protein
MIARFATILTALLLTGTVAFAADEPPKLNVESSCRIAAAGISGRSREACINDENTARKTLGDKWKDFSASQHRRCGDLIHMGGPPSYVELLTCLEMAQQAKQIPDRDLLDLPPGVKLMD